MFGRSHHQHRVGVVIAAEGSTGVSLNAIIGGTGIGCLTASCATTPRTIASRYGTIDIQDCRHEGTRYLFLCRHGDGHRLAPHEIDYRANIVALAEAGVTRIIATNAVGSLRDDLTPGTLLVVDDFIDFTRARPVTSTDATNGPVHADLSVPYCPEVRTALIRAGNDCEAQVLPHGVYVCVDGPRYETPAEVRMFSRWGGDVIGMTGVPEVVFAREQGICYASLAIVTNLGVGFSADPVRHGTVSEAVRSQSDVVGRILLHAAAALPAERCCACGRQ
jgi:5'-methylthioadenosine phosphorylase